MSPNWFKDSLRGHKSLPVKLQLDVSSFIELCCGSFTRVANAFPSLSCACPTSCPVDPSPSPLHCFLPLESQSGQGPWAPRHVLAVLLDLHRWIAIKTSIHFEGGVTTTYPWILVILFHVSGFLNGRAMKWVHHWVPLGICFWLWFLSQISKQPFWWQQRFLPWKYFYLGVCGSSGFILLCRNSRELVK